MPLRKYSDGRLMKRHDGVLAKCPCACGWGNRFEFVPNNYWNTEDWIPKTFWANQFTSYEKLIADPRGSNIDYHVCAFDPQQGIRIGEGIIVSSSGNNGICGILVIHPNPDAEVIQGTDIKASISVPNGFIILGDIQLDSTNGYPTCLATYGFRIQIGEAVYDQAPFSSMSLEQFRINAEAAGLTVYRHGEYISTATLKEMGFGQAPLKCAGGGSGPKVNGSDPANAGGNAQNPDVPGNGGDGYPSDIAGEVIYYGGGGGGASNGYNISTGGRGGGGAGASITFGGVNGADGLGGGGGGGLGGSISGNNGLGGLGVVYLRYRVDSGISATGGTISAITVDSVDYKLHRFTANGTFAVSAGAGQSIRYLIVGRGGNGGSFGSGGGGQGGQVLDGTFNCETGNYSISIGISSTISKYPFTLTAGCGVGGYGSLSEYSPGHGQPGEPPLLAQWYNPPYGPYYWTDSAGAGRNNGPGANLGQFAFYGSNLLALFNANNTWYADHCFGFLLDLCVTSCWAEWRCVWNIETSSWGSVTRVGNPRARQAGDDDYAEWALDTGYSSGDPCENYCVYKKVTRCLDTNDLSKPDPPTTTLPSLWRWTATYDCWGQSWYVTPEPECVGCSGSPGDWYSAGGGAMQKITEGKTPQPSAPASAPTCYYTWSAYYDCETEQWYGPSLMWVDTYGSVSGWQINEYPPYGADATCVTTSSTPPSLPGTTPSCE